MLHQKSLLRILLYAFGHHLQFHALRQPQQGFHNGRTVVVMRQVRHKRTVNLERMQGQLPQPVQR